MYICVQCHLTTMTVSPSLPYRLKSPHLYEEIQSYSIQVSIIKKIISVIKFQSVVLCVVTQELTEVHSGVLLEKMRKTVRTGSRHVRLCPVRHCSFSLWL